MADAVNQPIEPSAAAARPAASAAPAVTTPAAVAEAQASPAAPTPAASPAEGGAAPAAEAKPELIPSLLESFDKEKTDKAAAEAKPGEVKTLEKPAEAKPEDKKPGEVAAEAAAPEPIVYDYKLPDGFTIDEPNKIALNAALDSFRADPKAGVQSLIDLHAKQLTDYAAATLLRQYDVFNQTRKDWQKQVMSDPQIGGSGYETAMKAVARMRDKFVPEGDRKAFNDFLKITGAGDHPTFLRLMHNVARAFDEAKPPPANPKPPPNNGKPPRRGLRDMYRDSAGNG